MARGSAEMTGTTPAALTFPLELAWTFQTSEKRGEGVIATPVVKNGQVYIGGQNGRFYCIELATGDEVWSVPKKGSSKACGLRGDSSCGVRDHCVP